MTLDIQDYQIALAGFLKKLRSRDDCLKSLLLYGSMAQGTVRPGKSDIDLLVILRQDVMTDYKQFSNCFDTLIEACGYLAKSGIPYHHPVFYYFEDELSFLHESYHEIFRSEDGVKILFGDDVRSQIGGHTNPDFGKTALLEVWQQFCLPLARYLGKNELSQDEIAQVEDFLFKTFVGTVGWAVWMITSQPLEQINALALQEVMPDLDWTVVEQVNTWKAKHATISTSEYLLLLGQALRLLEVLISKVFVDPNT